MTVLCRRELDGGTETLIARHRELDDGTETIIARRRELDGGAEHKEPVIVSLKLTLPPVFLLT